MRLSKSFLREYVNIDDINYHELAEKMVFAGNEYESIEKLSSAKGLVVGEILECVRHPESNKLSICKVNIGDSEPVQILCGAPNVVDAKKVIVATVGAILPGGEIKKARLAGMDSHGMICSLDELGLDSKYVTEEDKKGIHILAPDAPVGIDAIHYLGFDDETIDFELTANRSDLLSILGMAYEVGAIYDLDVTEPKCEYSETDTNIESIMKLDVKTDACPIYLGKMVEGIVVKESPSFIKSRLMASGIRPINNVVDISNYVMLEYGQPLHFFDADRLGNHVVVRRAEEDEKLVTLDGINRTLKSSDIVIANNDKAVCLAGVMGGLDTEVENDTKNLFIEAAIFDPLHIRYTSKNILRSEASSRYEKGIDANRVEKAMNRACSLLEKYADGKVASGTLTHDKIDHNEAVIEISREKINTVLGLELSVNDITSVLKRLAFKVETSNDIFHITVPTRRLDVKIKEDIIEEVGRIYGYEHVTGKMPNSSVKKGGYTKRAKNLKDIRTRLSALGLNQVITYSLISEEDSNKFDNPISDAIYLQSPMSEERKVMRRNLISSLLDVYQYNVARGVKDIAIYETGNIYYKKEEEYCEYPVVGGLLSGTYLQNTWNGTKIDVDFYTVKGIVENMLNYLGLSKRYQFVVDEDLLGMHPGRSCKIVVDRKTVGYLGQIHPKHTKKEVYVFHIDIQLLESIKTRGIKFKEMNKYPIVKKDVAFIVNQSVTSEEITSVIAKSGGRQLTNIQVFDVYVGDNVENGKKSIAYSLEFQDMTKTLNDEEITIMFNRIIESVQTKLDAKLRDK